jgi:hypothetical protein
MNHGLGNIEKIKGMGNRYLEPTYSNSATQALKTPTIPDPDVLVQEIVEDLEAALEQFREIANDLGKTRSEPTEY